MIELEKMDVRTIQRFLQKGTISQAEYEAYLAKLPDSEAEAEFVNYSELFREEEAAALAAQQEAARQERVAAETHAQEIEAPLPPATATALSPEPPRMTYPTPSNPSTDGGGGSSDGQ